MSKKWKVDFKPSALKDLKKIDRKDQRKILHYLEFLVEELDHPRMVGKPLKGLQEIWRYRSGAYRILCQIKDDVITITVISIGHRKDVYKNI